MAKREESLFEVLMLLGAIASGGIFILIQRWLFTSGIIPLLDVEPSKWVSSAFIPASLIVFAISAISAILWYLMALKIRPEFRVQDGTLLARAKWVAFLLAPVFSIIVTLIIFGEASPTAFPYFFVFLVINMLVTFWLSTALATPTILAHVVLFAPLIRSVLRLD
ncbi:MAG: hypothetical protein QNJ68_22580 [Microcoleaceae cyanobacterium MO_207.B10]|nr:hypothetical protein [Microcoleaceae cyanobacterium MO_207.B10]